MKGKVVSYIYYRFIPLGSLFFLPMVLFFIDNNTCLASSLPTPWKQNNYGEYETGITRIDAFSGTSCAFIKSKNTAPKQSGTIEQFFSIPPDWLGKTIKLTAYFKVVQLDSIAGLSVLVQDSKDKSKYNLTEIKNANNGWKQYGVLLDIPYNAVKIGFGAWLLGQGEIHVDAFAFQVSDRPIDGEYRYLEKGEKPMYNLNFEEKSIDNSLQNPWVQINAGEYETGINSSDSYSGHNSAYIRSKNLKKNTYGCFYQYISIPTQWLGHKILLSAYLKSINVEISSGLIFRINYENGDFSQDQMKHRPVVGNTDWTQYNLVLEVPHDSVLINFGACLKGKGEIRADEFNFKIVDDTIETTGKYHKWKYGYPKNLDFESLENQPFPAI